MQGLHTNIAHFLAPQKAGLRQRILSLSRRLAFGTPENAGVT